MKDRKNDYGKIEIEKYGDEFIVHYTNLFGVPHSESCPTWEHATLFVEKYLKEMKECRG